MLPGFSKPKLIEVPNRDEESGKVLNIFDDVTKKVKKEIEENNNFVIFHILECSKLGHRYDEMEKIKNLSESYKDNLMIVVDACQSRTDINRVRDYLKMGCIVLITGSKFEQGPPFSAAAIIPPKNEFYGERNLMVPEGLKDFITRYDITGPIDFIKEQLPVRMNVGLMLRWNIGITNWEDYRKITFNTRKSLVNAWVNGFMQLLENYDNIALFSGGEHQLGSVGDVNSIFSLKLIFDNEYLNYEQLKDIYFWMRKDMSGFSLKNSEKNFLRKSFLIGQPVSINNLNVVRIALGARLVNEMHEKGVETVLKQDRELLDKMEFLTKNYNRIKENG